MTVRLQAKLNDLLDACAVPVKTWRGREIPAFRFWAGTALSVSVFMALVLAHARGLSLGWMSAAVAAATAACYLLALSYKAVTGDEQFVFLHHALLATASVALVASLAGRPVLAFVEITTVCFGLLLAIGRLGCFSAGCCHGRPHAWGVCYGPRHVGEGFEEALEGVRLLPVQLLESAWAAAAALAGVVALLAGFPAGVALSWFLPAYSAGRFGAELLRGDSVRTWHGPLSDAQWICIALCAVSLCIPSASFAAQCVAGFLLAAMLAALASRKVRRWAQPFDPEDVLAVAGAVRSVHPEGMFTVSTTPRGWRLSQGSIPQDNGCCMHWCVSGFPSERLAPLTRLLLTLRGLPPSTPVRIDTVRSVTHILAFPGQEKPA